MKLITLLLSCADRQEAQQITNSLLDKKLVACVRSVDVQSVYWWKGKKEKSSEVQLVIESSEEKFNDIEKAVRAIHSYEHFVLLAYPVLRSSKGVDSWLKESLV